MKASDSLNAITVELPLILGARGKTGRRIAQRFDAAGLPYRAGSRNAALPFEWNEPATWAPVLHGVSSVYVAYYPDLAVPGAAATIDAFVREAKANGVQHVVLLSGRGEPEARACEQVVKQSGVAWTILRSSWFAQNFSENFFADEIAGGEVVLPVSSVTEPFVDVDDLADIAFAALTDNKHRNQLYELTGPRLLTFGAAIAEIAAATGRDIDVITVTREQYNERLQAMGVPPDVIWLLDYLFSEVLDGRNASLTDGVQRALGRPARDFRDYVRRAMGSGLAQPA
jgi:uncharacterized protein YbjT (DUF2867 family)